ncbi:HAD family hydrolase [Agrobacterium sp. T29]|uniref:HAD family hydrolase n=1 Tax=Agrobacterium sp. T29 TaxID=2580515 RepID=UPI00115CA08C|nr:HAD-IA family hydrolase [Agrobacterium sp. T29]
MTAAYIIWDFEGTLATRKGRYTGALERAAEQLDPDFAGSADRLRPHLSGAFPWHGPKLAHPHADDPQRWWAVILNAARKALITNGMEQDLIETVLIASRRIYLDPAGWECDPDALATLQALTERGWSHAILSNFAPELPDLVAALGFASHVDHIFCSGRIGLEKPAPALFAHVKSALSPGKACWMIGDNPAADIDGGREAGLATIHLAPHGPGTASGLSVQMLREIATLIPIAPINERSQS